MKTSFFTLFAICASIGSFTMEVTAQEAIKALARKCENMESVNSSFVRMKDPKTKKLTRVITSISVQSNPALVNEFLAAFEKEKDNADKEIESRNQGKISLFYRFGNVSCSFSIESGAGSDNSGTGRADISIIEDYN